MFTLQLQFPSLANGSSCYTGTSSLLSSCNTGRTTRCNIMSSHMGRGRAGGAGVFAMSTAVEAPVSRGVRDGVSTLEDGFPAGLRADLMPKHVSFIMDGNGRWAREKGLRFEEGYVVGMSKLKQMVEHSYKWGVQAVSFYAFSTENWRRPQEEIDFLMKLFEDSLRVDMDRLMRCLVSAEMHTAAVGTVGPAGIYRVCMVGDPLQLPRSLQTIVMEAEEATKNNSKFKLITAINYSGRYDIVQACKKVANKVKDGELEPKDINELLFENHLETSWKINAPLPDLLVRTSGELRLSNYLLWQLAYTEFFFLDLKWPDLGEADYVEALRSFQNRKRRFGKKSE